jgi:hypothetical protein
MGLASVSYTSTSYLIGGIFILVGKDSDVKRST